MVIGTMVVYLLAQLILCVFLSRFIKTESDYFVAKRNFPLSIVAISLFATWFGAETCISSAAMVYRHGLSGARADPLGYSLCLFLAGLFIAGRIWNKNYVTLSDFYKDRFSVSVERLSAFILAFSSLVWAAAQIRAFGQVISATTSLDLQSTMLMGLLFVLAYTSLGGLMGDMLTDVIQGAVILLGLSVLLIAVFINTPDIVNVVKDIPIERWSLVGAHESFLMRAERLSIPILGSLVSQEIISKIYAAKSPSIAVKACYFGGGIYIVLGFIPVFIGLLGPQIFTFTGDPERFLLSFANTQLSPLMVGVFAGALISALLATIDSVLLACSALTTHNLLIPILKIKSEKRKLLLSRLMVMAFGLLAYILAVYSDGIYDLLETASSLGTAGILVITLIGLWSGFGDQVAAFASLGAAAVISGLEKFVWKGPYPFLFSLSVSLVVYIIVSLFRRQFKPTAS